MQQHLSILNYTFSILSRMRVAARILREGDRPETLDMGLRSMVNLRSDYLQTFLRPIQKCPEGTMLFLTDQFRCNYIFLRLPEKNEGIVIGPYLGSDLPAEEVLEIAENHALPAGSYSILREYYASLPVVVDTSPLQAIVKTLGESLWGREMDCETLQPAREKPLSPTPLLPEEERPDILYHMKNLEKRYAYENQLMHIVSKGLLSQAEMSMQGVSHLNFAKRAPDPLRNMKNYGIVLNTLLRKAAEKGGVHPVHLDETSGVFAHMLENMPGEEKCLELFSKMIITYTRLVKAKATGHYSQPVQKALSYVEENLSGDLSLSTLAQKLSLSPGYLSTLFHRETGTPLGSHISLRRMETAAHLLKTTRLLVQSIAQYCGITDTNYFSRLFKKHYGKTPKQFREEE